jgi:hypothetical protein
MTEPVKPGPSEAPENPNPVPEHLSRFNDQFEVADLRAPIENGDFEDVSLDPKFGVVPVPLLVGPNPAHLPAVKLGALIRARVAESEDGVLIASFYRLTLASVDPVLAFATRRLMPVVILAAAHAWDWAQAVSPAYRKRNAVMLCYPGGGMTKQLAIGLPEAHQGRLANGLFLVNRPSDEHVPHFLATCLPPRADGPLELDEIGKTLDLIRKLPSR